LWPALRQQADAEARDAREKLTLRADREATQMAELLDRQKERITKQFTHFDQTTFKFEKGAEAERDQFNRDRRYMEQRLEAIETERETEPAAIRDSYKVVLARFEPVGLAYLWPAS
jgi:hypothetical protein